MKTRIHSRGLWRLAVTFFLLPAVSLGLLAQDRDAVSPSATDETPVGKPKQEAKPQRDRISAYTSPWIDEVVKLANAGIDESVILAYIDSAGTFNLGSEEIISLRRNGVSDALISVILAHDAAYASGARQNPPGPPASAHRLLLASSASGSTSAPSPPSEQQAARPNLQSPFENATTIVHPSPAEELEPFLLLPDFSMDQKPRPADIAPASAHCPPVRRPYPVQLTDTIYVYRAAWKTPNIQILRWLPEGR